MVSTCQRSIFLILNNVLTLNPYYCAPPLVNDLLVLSCLVLSCLHCLQVLDALLISKATFNKIRQNLWWAFGYNVVGIPVAAGALLPAFGVALTPSISGAVMALSSLAVMSNSLLLQLEAQRHVQRTTREAAEAETTARSRAEAKTA